MRVPLNLLADMETEEQRLLEQRTAESDTRVRRALATVVFLTCGMLLYSFLRRVRAEKRTTTAAATSMSEKHGVRSVFSRQREPIALPVTVGETSNLEGNP